MDYEKMFEAQQEKGQMNNLTPEIIQWDTEGMQITGELVMIEEFQNNKYDEPCNVYILQTNTGMKTMVLGQATDRRLSNLREGAIVKITYKGIKDLDGGKRCNQFEVLTVPLPTED